MGNKQLYFLGSTSPIGYQTNFFHLINKKNYFTYILKGGPGTGKSTLMNKIASEFDDRNLELFYCSTDISALDAVIINDIKTIIVDGTTPHVFDPIYPAVSQEIVNLGEFWDRDKMSPHKEAIIHCTDENLKCHSRAKRYVRAFASLNSNIYSIAYNYILNDKLDGFINRLVHKLFPKGDKKLRGMEFRHISAFTSKGYLTQPIPDDYKIYTLNDDYFAGSDYFLKSVSDIALDRGLKIILSECAALSNNIYEHMLIPELRIAFISCNFFNKLELDCEKAINFNRFYDKESLSSRKQKIAFDKKACLELANEASSAITTSNGIHNKLEEYYIKSIDFNGLDIITQKIIEDIKKKI
ncbi:MAG: ATPase [Clostridiales bacterium]|nr:ATPase [Clostridiales bacterium]